MVVALFQLNNWLKIIARPDASPGTKLLGAKNKLKEIAKRSKPTINKIYLLIVSFLIY